MEIDNRYVVLIQRTRTWWRKIRTRPEVYLLRRGETIHDDASIVEGLAARELLSGVSTRSTVWGTQRSRSGLGSGRRRPVVLEGHTDIVKSVAIGAIGDTEVIASASDDTTIRVWTSRERSEPVV